MVAIGRSRRRKLERHNRGHEAREEDAREARGGQGEGSNDVFRRVKEGASGAAEYVQSALAAAATHVRDTAGELTGGVLDTLLDEAERLYDGRKEQAISRIAGAGKLAGRTAHALHAVKADGIAGYMEQAAKRVGSAGDYLEDRTLGEILEDAGDLVQRNPAVAVGGMFIAGFALTRFLKASQSRGNDGGGDAPDNRSRERGDGGGGGGDGGPRRRRGVPRKQ